MQFAAVLRAICGGFAGKTGRDFLLVEVLSVKQRRRIGIQDHEGLAGSGFRITKGSQDQDSGSLKASSAFFFP